MTPRRTLKIFNEHPVKRRNAPLLFLSILLFSIQFLPSNFLSLSLRLSRPTLSSLSSIYLFHPYLLAARFLDFPVIYFHTTSFQLFRKNAKVAVAHHGCMDTQHIGCFRRNLPCFEETFLGLIYRDVIQQTFIWTWTITEWRGKKRVCVVFFFFLRFHVQYYTYLTWRATVHSTGPSLSR